jgi:hypothetical protein
MRAKIPSRLNRHGSRGRIGLNSYGRWRNSRTHPLDGVVFVDQHKLKRLLAFGVVLELADEARRGHRMVGVDHREVRITVDSLAISRGISDNEDRRG